MSDLQHTAIKNWLQATADDAMGMEPGDRAMAHAAKYRIEELEAGFAWLKEFVDAQAEDAGLWAEAEYASEAYIQLGLRGCHAAIEKALAALEKEND